MQEPINMQDLYAQDPGAETASGEGSIAEAGQVGDNIAQAQSANATATGANASSVSDTVFGQAQNAVNQTPAVASSASEAVSGATDNISAGQTNATGTTAVTSSIAPSSTVQEQLNQITAQGGPLLDRAASQGERTAARRGLQNSSIAAGAAQGALVDRALPIAQQDAQTYFQQALQNQANEQRSNELSSDAQNQADQLQAQLDTNVNLAGLEANTSAALQDAQLETQTSQFNTEQGNRLEALNAELGTQTSQFNAQQANAISTLNAQLEQDASQFTAAERNRIAALNAQLDTDVNTRNAAARNEGAFQDAQLRSQIADANAARTLALQQGNAQEINRQTQFILDMNSDLNKQFLAGEQALDLADIQGRYQSLIATNNNAAGLYNSYFSSVAEMMANDDISPGRVASQSRILQDQLNSGLNLIEQISNTDLTGQGTPTAQPPGPATGIADPTPPQIPNPVGSNSTGQINFGGTGTGPVQFNLPVPPAQGTGLTIPSFDLGSQFGGGRSAEDTAPAATRP